ncbi:hypothetical protein JCM4814A_02010 [Streptomyces phaeofaciens JCM 4814]|uniref:Uncharacterized protein n=1 Tax=Streptomyces phaeofaciens TaxID=68254 RepID=A0A918HT86_9ACTN|nr:hypothetical protein GCM10010226_91780 [Streptomyces phaeofaciens]
MTASARTWTVSSTAALLHHTSGWLLDDPLQGAARELGFGNETLWDFLRGLVELRTVTAEMAMDAAMAAGVPEAAADRCVESFQRTGILVPTASSPSLHPEAPVLHAWRLANLALPADYRDPDTLIGDVQQMENFAAAEVPPPVATQWPTGLRRILLAHPIHDAPNRPHYALGSVLYYSNAILRSAELGPLPRSLRVPPSFGAGHPFDLTVTMDSRHVGMPVTFAYDPLTHALIQISTEFDVSVPPGHALIAVHLAIRRVQWRYRASTAYPTVFLDLGHLLEVMETAAESLDLVVTEAAPPEQGPIADQAPSLGPILALRSLRMTGEKKEAGEHGD